MNKEWKNMLIFLGILIFIGWWLITPTEDNSSVSYEYTNETNLSNNLEVVLEKEEILDDFSNIERLHWTHMPLKFHINLSGLTKYSDEERAKREGYIRKAMERLTQNINSITFEEVENSSEADINFFITIPYSLIKEMNTGININPSVYEETEGLSIPEFDGKYIIHSEVYISKGCPDSNIALHELLHSFGVEHSKNDFGDLMSSKFVNCNPFRRMDEETINCLKYIYSNGREQWSCEGIVSFETESSSCSIGWYRVEGTDYCCPEPNMIIDEDGYCV